MKILVIRYRFIGDMILTAPFLRNLRYAYPNAQIDMLVSPNSGEVIAGCPYVNNFIYFDTSKKHKYEQGAVSEKKSFFQHAVLLRRQKYDKAYVLKRSFSSALLAFSAGIKERIGFDTEFRGWLLTKKIPYDAKKHESLCFLDVLKADGIAVKDTYIENWVREDDIKKVRSLLQSKGIQPDEKFAAVNAAASNPYKMWDINNFAGVIEYLSNEKGIRTVFIGSRLDYPLYEKMQFKNTLKKQYINLCGELSIQESLALLKQAALFIGNDSGSAHMASSVNTPVICLYGPMPAEKWRVLGKGNILIEADTPCAPCSLKKNICRHDKACMKSISIEQVKQAAAKLLDGA